MNNPDIAKIFYAIADILELQGVEFKPVAYRKAARSIESYSRELHEIYKKEGIKGLRKIPGIGQHIALKTEEILKTGKLHYYEKLKKDVPEGVTALMEVPGIGPKKAALLSKKLGIKSVNDLKKAVELHKIKGLAGFGEKSEQDIEAGISIVRKSKERMPIGFALPIAEAIKKTLWSCKDIKRVELAGSLRRMKETVGDFDILATSTTPENAMHFFTSMPDVKRVLARGNTKSSVRLKNNVQVDLRIVDENSFGAALQYFIGSKDHNIAIRKIAMSKGLKLSEYGLFRSKSNDKCKGKDKGRDKGEIETQIQIAGKNEEDIYRAIGLEYVPPEIRENTGEIELAQKHMLPKLVEQKDIFADFHVHSKYSDGNNTIAEIAHACIEIGYEYVIISDHYHLAGHCLDEKSIAKQHKEIDLLNKAFEREKKKPKKNFRVLKGIEVNILRDGSLDAPVSVLKECDVVIAAVHSVFKMPKAEFTKRLVAALENKYTKVLAHPSCRHFGVREPSDMEFSKVIEAAKQNNKFLEINANINRLDLNDINARLSRESGVLLAIGTDAHAIDHLGFMRYGVAVARRAWCEKKDVLNTCSYRALEKVMK